MEELGRLIILIVVLGLALTLAAVLIGRLRDPRRANRRALRQALGAEPRPALATAHAAVGLDLQTARIAAAWDRGGWRLDWSISELSAVELIIDRQITARAARGSGARSADRLDPPDEQAALRFVFDDPDQPEFLLDLWRADDPARSVAHDADTALAEGRAWISRMDAVLRRAQAPPPPRVHAAAPAAADPDDVDADDG